MFKNDYKDKFGDVYESDVFNKAQATNKWSLAYSLLYALSKNGMKYATAKTGPTSAAVKTSLGCTCQIKAKPTDPTGSVYIGFKRMYLKITVGTSTDGRKAFPTNITIVDEDDSALVTILKYDPDCTDEGIIGKWTFGPKCSDICDWSNNPDTDEGKYRAITATFEDSKGSSDCISVTLSANSRNIASIMFFKAVDYFTKAYRYGVGVYRYSDGTTVFKFSDKSDVSLSPMYSGVNNFGSKIARAVFFVGPNFSGLIGGINGIYEISNGTEKLSLLPGNKVSVNGRDFQAAFPGLFARTS